MSINCNIILSQDNQSVVRRLIANIPAALVNVAPERLSYVIGHLENGRVDLEIVESRKQSAWFSPADKKISITTRILEILWAQSYAYFTFYREILSGTEPDGRTICLRNNQQVSDALDLLAWAKQEKVAGSELPWPKNLPSPEPVPEEESYCHIAQEISLFAVGFILHHELAHYCLKHNLGGSSEQERDADYEAMDWIMSSVDENDEGYKKRALGASVALLYLVVKGVYTGQHGGGTHPKDYNRLFQTLQRHISPNYHAVWAFVSGMLSLYMQDAGIPVVNKEHDSFYNLCDDLVNQLSWREAGVK